MVKRSKLLKQNLIHPNLMLKIVVVIEKKNEKVKRVHTDRVKY